eukprot:4213444-Pyramimonas_sp.AAC.1
MHPLQPGLLCVGLARLLLVPEQHSATLPTPLDVRWSTIYVLGTDVDDSLDHAWIPSALSLDHRVDVEHAVALRVHLRRLLQQLPRLYQLLVFVLGPLGPHALLALVGSRVVFFPFLPTPVPLRPTLEPLSQGSARWEEEPVLRDVV